MRVRFTRFIHSRCNTHSDFLTGPSTYRLAATSTALGAPSSFHTSAPLAQSRKKINARRKKQKVLALRDLRAREDVREQMDPVLGDFKKEAVAAAVAAEARSARQGASATSLTSAGQADQSLLENATGGSKWDRSLLKKVVLDRNDIWYSQPPQYDQNTNTVNDSAAGDENAFPLPNRPTLFSQHLTSPTDVDFLFKHLPEAGLARATYLAESATSPEELARRAAEETPAQVKASEQLMRILDLRNANSRGIRTVNVRRIVEVFGGSVDASAPTSTSSATAIERLDTGSSQVQAAILTHRIRMLADHIAANPRDVHNRKNLRALVHQRAKILRYYKKRVARKTGEGLGVYEELLDKIGVDGRAVEGEITVR
ncbi:hypothetical protein QFC19_001754 [Naganishia cerealis]|uniref:Uncharacterized protein n=1 Tax=Naganishia cerealis TaxID=610337 RepID=A0ACC2WF43_9TREE|nr:hypothetical protein QFC19_001754 [Naganishia cerealis]